MRVLIAAGGTGGHFYPGLAVLEALRERTSVSVMFIGTPRGIEARTVPALGEPLALLDVAPLNGVHGMALATAMSKLPRAGWACARVLRTFRPDLVLSVGGYAAGPVTAMALAARVRTALIEPNAFPGLTHRAVGRFVDRAYLTYYEAAGYFRPSSVRVLGTPVRRAFLEKASRAAATVRKAIPHVLVLGGSQGAQALNRLVPESVEYARGVGSEFTITHQTGTKQHADVVADYGARTLPAEVVPFIEDVASAMARADVVVSRAGAGIVAELCVMGRGSVLIPLPTAADDHQRKNAEAMAARGAAKCFEQGGLTAAALGAELAALVRDREGLEAMGLRARELAALDAAGRVAQDLLVLAHGAR